MKKENLGASKPRKLMLHRETLKALTPSQLTDVAGGVVLNPEFPSQCSCCITECCC
jgi:hypothetical protein